MRRLPCLLFVLLTSASVIAQTDSTTSSGNFYARWSARTNAIQSKQPAWCVPLVTTYTGLFQVVRTDFVRQVTAARTDTWNFDNSKGVNFIPWSRTEIDVDLPPFIQHNTIAKDGAGDMSFLGKIRIASGNEQHGTYNVSFFLLATVPTGSYKNGSSDASVAPALGLGKGFGRFDVQTTAGATLYTGTAATNASGKPVVWNAVAQYRIGKYFFPEIESNATFYKGGANDGKQQEFATPGLLIGKFKVHREDPRSRPGLVFGGGMQIATSHYHSYNHALITTARWIF